MMFYYLKSLVNINDFLASQEKLILIQNGKLKINGLNFECSPIMFLFSKKQKIFWFKDINWENFYIDLSVNQVIKVNYKIGLACISKDYLLTFESGVLKIINADDFTKAVTLDKIISFQSYLIERNNLIGYTNENTIYLFNRIIGANQWQSNLSEYGTIRKVLGVCGQNLWLTTEDRLPDSDSNKLIALSINDGAILQVTDHNYTFASFWVELLINEEKIVSIRGDAKNLTHFYEYCAKTGNILRNQTIDSLEVNGLSIICATVKEKLIYFTATDHTQIVANHVGVLDFETLEVLWFEKVNPGNLKLEPPQVAGNKIYVLGGDGTLHIFEKEI